MQNDFEELRPITVPELGELSVLLDHVFPPVGGMFPVFPTFLSSVNCHNLYGFFRNGELLAHVGTNRRIIHSRDISLSAACIGAVAVTDAARGCGIASRLLEYAYTRIQADGVHIALISGDRGLYTRSGAIFYGRAITHTHRAGSSQSSIRVWDPDSDLPGCMRLHESENVRFCRDSQDWELLVREGRTVDGPATVLIPEDGSAYVVIREESRGRWQVVEYAGARRAVADIVNAWSAQHRRARINIEVPAHDKDMVEALKLDTSRAQPYPGTLRVIDRDALLESLPPDIAGDCPSGDSVALAAHVFGGDSEARIPVPLYGLDFV